MAYIYVYIYILLLINMVIQYGRLLASFAFWCTIPRRAFLQEVYYENEKIE